MAAKAVIVEEVERLHWRLWNGKAKDAHIGIDRIRAVMHHFRKRPASGVCIQGLTGDQPWSGADAVPTPL
jgi:hypothetical protein